VFFYLFIYLFIFNKRLKNKSSHKGALQKHSPLSSHHTGYGDRTHLYSLHRPRHILVDFDL